MKSSTGPQSATSLPRAPRDDAGSRTLRYFLMMTIRVVCFVLMVVITPYGWHTAILGVGAIVLPYVAVVIANVGQDGRKTRRIDPERALPAAPTGAAPTERPNIVRIEETRAIASSRPSESPKDPAP